MKSLAFLCALSGIAAAQIQIGGGGIRIGGPKPQPQPQQQPQQQPARSQQQQPAQPQQQEQVDTTRAATEAWRQVQRDYEDRLARLYEYETQPHEGPIGTDQYANTALRYWKEVDKLADVKKGCEEHRYDGERAGVSYNEQFLTAKTMCPLIVRADEIYKKGVRNYAAAYGLGTLSNLTNTLSKIQKDKQVFVSDAVAGIDIAERRKYISSFVGKYYEALGEPIPEDLLTKVDGMVAEMNKAIETAAAEGKPEKVAAKDAGAEKAIAETYKARHKGIQIKRVYMIDSVWKIKHNNIGLITNRYKDGSVVVKAKGVNACIIVPAAVGQAYAGGGRYSAHYEVDEYTSGTPIKCGK
jgi:hypothetical protein